MLPPSPVVVHQLYQSHKLLKEGQQALDNALLFASAISATKAGHGRHYFIYICAGGFQ